jgi:hypothetical protein
MADMTIAVYKINRDTGKRTDIRPRQTVKPQERPALSTQWPDCTCQRCLNSRTAQNS